LHTNKRIKNTFEIPTCEIISPVLTIPGYLWLNSNHLRNFDQMVPFQNRPVHIRPITTDHSKQTTFVTDLLITDLFITYRVHNRPRS